MGSANLKTVSSRKLDKKLLHRLKCAKRYLKSKFQSHCSTESQIVSHNPRFALSSPQEEPCLDISDEICADCYNLISVLQLLENEAMTHGTEDEQYDVKQSIESIIKYMKHQMRDFQQRHAKSFCFNNLDEATAFWLKDFAQKILPQSYREGQKEYFGKKGMSLHIDVFFRKYNDELLKYVYFTCIFRSQQSIIDVLNIGEHVIEKFKTDCPMILNLYTKSDNAGCYHGNYILEATYKLCKSFGLNLLRYDFNEPCKGKDQCDRESAGAKTKINGFVNSGNNIKEAKDVYDALHHGNGIKNSQVSVIEINSAKSILVGTDIPSITAYHSIQFYEDHMKLYRYWNIGPGKIFRYNDNCAFTSSFNRLKDFSQTEKDVTLYSSKKKKKRRDHEICNLLFCPEPSCSETFESKNELDEHLLSEQHVVTIRRSSMDIARSSFIRKMKVSSQLHTEHVHLGIDVSETKLADAIEETPLLRRISEQGWALPRRKTFRYSYEQKKILYDIFMDGEKTGKKKSPDEAERLLRTKLKPKEYVTSSQIRSLFSTFSKQLREGTLKAPEQGKKDHDDYGEKEHIDEVDEVDEENENEYQLTIHKNVLAVVTDLAEWEIGDYVAACYNDKWYPGQVTVLNDDGSVTVNCMRYVDQYFSANKFVWPSQKDEKKYEKDELLLKLDAPQQLQTGKRYQYYKFNESDFTGASDILRMILDTK